MCVGEEVGERKADTVGEFVGLEGYGVGEGDGALPQSKSNFAVQFWAGWEKQLFEGLQGLQSLIVVPPASV
jgi:hypothetical protein